MTAAEIVEKLGLEILDQEGGWFRRIYTDEVGEGVRPRSTSVFALFTREQFSALHRLDAEEQFFFLDGDAFEVFEITALGSAVSGLLGPARLANVSPHRVFSRGSWFGGRPVGEGTFGWSLVAAVVTPGFEWAGFEIGNREELTRAYPLFEDRIRALTRP